MEEGLIIIDAECEKVYFQNESAKKMGQFRSALLTKADPESEDNQEEMNNNAAAASLPLKVSSNPLFADIEPIFGKKESLVVDKEKKIQQIEELQDYLTLKQVVEEEMKQGFMAKKKKFKIKPDVLTSKGSVMEVSLGGTSLDQAAANLKD